MEQEKLVKYHIEKKDSPASQWDCAPPPPSPPCGGPFLFIDFVSVVRLDYQPLFGTWALAPPQRAYSVVITRILQAALFLNL